MGDAGARRPLIDRIIGDRIILIGWQSGSFEKDEFVLGGGATRRDAGSVG